MQLPPNGSLSSKLLLRCPYADVHPAPLHVLQQGQRVHQHPYLLLSCRLLQVCRQRVGCQHAGHAVVAGPCLLAHHHNITTPQQQRRRHNVPGDTAAVATVRSGDKGDCCCCCCSGSPCVASAKREVPAATVSPSLTHSLTHLVVPPTRNTASHPRLSVTMGWARSGSTSSLWPFRVSPGW